MGKNRENRENFCPEGILNPIGIMPVITYFDKIIPYLRALIDENKLFEQKIQ